jgi:hypothetical protein
VRKTILWRSGFVAAALAGLVTGEGSSDEEAPQGLVHAVRAPDGTVRVPFLGGAFMTRNREMPIEMEQAIAGEPTDHPVVVLMAD